MNTELAEQIVHHPRWSWREGMADAQGVRVVDLDLWTGSDALPDLSDFATAGVLLGVLTETGLFTDVVLQDGEWIVAVDLPGEGLQGWAADTLGEAAAWALLAAWGAVGGDASA
ncbi:MAG TPA: hypothetical protein ENK18_12200 [Deltaproteobacteria bacterium]|nr:hypothetical protein [Deltaproteobacteria bacterium]